MYTAAVGGARWMWYGSAMLWLHRSSPLLIQSWQGWRSGQRGRSGRGRWSRNGAWIGLGTGILVALLGAVTGQKGRPPGIASAWAAPQDEISRRDFAISGFKPPPRWEVLPNERRSYTQLLAWASRGDGPERSVITLVGKRLPRGATLKTMIDEALALREDPRARNVRAQLQLSPGWTPNQRVQLDAQLAATKTQRAQVLRQLIYMNPPFAYVLTLVCPQEQAPARYRDLDDTAANLIPLPVAPAGSPPLPSAVAPAPVPGSSATSAAAAAAQSAQADAGTSGPK